VPTKERAVGTSPTVTPENLDGFKAAYEACKGESFFWQGQEILKAYAKWVIYYLEQVLEIESAVRGD
jgi:hypothetical protein